MFSTSADILNLILAVCIIVLTFFLSWAIYYLISGVQKIHKIIRRVEAGVTQAEEILVIAKQKIKSGSAYLMILAEVAKRALEYAKKDSQVNNKKESGPTKTKKKK